MCRNWETKSREKRSKEVIISELWSNEKEKLIEVTRTHVSDTVRAHIVEDDVDSDDDLNNNFARQATLKETSMEQEYYQARGSARGNTSDVPTVLTFVEKRRVYKRNSSIIYLLTAVRLVIG